MAGSGRKNADDALLAALAGGATVQQAAGQAAVSERTAHRRLADPAFRRRVADLRGEMVTRAVGKMADGMSDAAAKLRELLTAESESVRLGAARSLLELGVKMRESAELEQRLADLERRIKREGRQ